MSANSSSGFALASWREFRPSQRLRRIGAALHLCCAGCCLALVPLWPLGCLLTAGVAVNAVRFLRRCADLPVSLRVAPDGRWRLETGRRGACDCRLLTPVVVTPQLILARFQAENGGYTLLIGADSLPADSFRRLRVRLIQSAYGR